MNLFKTYEFSNMSRVDLLAYLCDCPLEVSHNTVFDLIEVLHSLGNIHQQVGTISVRSKAPNLSGLGYIPLVGVSEVAGTSLHVLTMADLTLLNVFCQTILEGTGLHEQTVVLVG